MTFNYGKLIMYFLVIIPTIIACFVVGFASLKAGNFLGLLMISVGIVLALYIIFRRG